MLFRSLRRPLTSKYLQASLCGNQFPSRHPLRSLWPRPRSLLPVKKMRQDLQHVRPVNRMVRLQHKSTTGAQCSVNKTQKLRSNQSPGYLVSSIPRLWMVTMDLRNRTCRRVIQQQLTTTDHGSPSIVQPPMIGPPRGITNHNGQNIHPQKITLRSGQRPQQH